MEIKKIKLFIGTGGVGKTTLASLYALNLVRKFPGDKIKLITIDPSRRLKDYFGMKSIETEKSIDNLNISLNSRGDLLRDFVLNAYKGDEEKVDKIFSNRIFQKVVGGLAVSQEFTSLYEICKSEGENYDHIIVDTPPLQNAGSFLSGADNLKGLFSSSLVRLFISDKEQGLFQKIFFRAQRKSFDILAKLTGSGFVHELADFFESVEQVRAPLLEVLKKSKLILEKQTEVICVCNHNELSLAGLLVSLRGLKMQSLFIERCYINKFDKEKAFKESIRKRMKKLKSEYKNIDFLEVEKFKQDLSSYEDLVKVSEYVEFQRNSSVC